MKNAFVLVAHTGDRGKKKEGDIILDLSNTRFDELEKIGLVREAKSEEVRNWEPPFEAEADAKGSALTVTLDVAGLQSLKDELSQLGSDLFDARDVASRYVDEIAKLRELNTELADENGRLKAEREEATAEKERQNDVIAKLTEERDRALAPPPAGDASGGEKAAEAPANAKAPAASNKAAPSANAKA